MSGHLLPKLQLKTSLLAPRRLRLHLCHRPTTRLCDEHMWSDPDFIEAVDRMEAAVAQAAAPEAVVAQAAHDSAPFWPLDKVRLTLAPRQADEDWFTKPADMVDFVFFRPCFRLDGVQRSAKLRMRINVTSLAGLNKAFRQRRLRGKPGPTSLATWPRFVCSPLCRDRTKTAATTGSTWSMQTASIA